MNLLLFIVILIISLIAVRIGAVAFQLTGLEWSLAKFQALSCFTGTGFTTKEAELITGNLQRRRIASVLMVLGSAGLVTLIATFVNTLRPSPSTLLPWMNLLIIVLSIGIIYLVFTRTGLSIKFTNALRSRIVKKELIKSVSFEELLVSTGGYGISNIEVCKDSPVLDKTILETGLRKYDITILVVERGEKATPNPSAGTKILLGDRLICFGKLDNIRKKLCSTSE